MNADLGLMPKRIWIELQDRIEPDACDVTVEMEDGRFFTALFVTMPYLRRQMQLSADVSKQLPDAPVVRYAAMETSHILVENLDHDTIEDTMDNLLALDTFETVFSPVVDPHADPVERERTTQVAQVVLTEILKAEETTVA